MKCERIALKADVVQYELGKGLEDGTKHVCGADKIWKRYKEI